MKVVAAAQPQSQSDPEEGIEIPTTTIFEASDETTPERSSSFGFGRWWKWAAAGIFLTLGVIVLASGTYGVVATKNQEANNVYASPLEEVDDTPPCPCDCPPDDDVVIGYDDRRKRRHLDGGVDDDGYGPLGGYDQNHRWLDGYDPCADCDSDDYVPSRRHLDLDGGEE